MLILIIILSAIITANYLRMFMYTDNNEHEGNADEVNGFNLTRSWTTVLADYGRQFAEYCISTSYLLYVRLTLVNLTIFLLKYVPTGFYMYKLVKDVYVTYRRRINERRMEIDDIQLQIKIVNTKLCFRDAEFTEHTEKLRQSAERLRSVRARVRDMIAKDEGLRHTLVTAAQWDAEHDAHIHYASEERDQQFIVELIGEIKNVSGTNVNGVSSPEKACNDSAPTDQQTPENSVYSSLSDDARQDYRVKIVKVTNVYKVAYLKNFIKQKKLRRANKQAILKKKMENIKNLLEDWQRTLNMVINSKMTILNIDSHSRDMISQEAMGDYAKSGFSDSDLDLRNSLPDSCYDEYNRDIPQNQYIPYNYNYEGVHLMGIVEETNSQLAVEENKSEMDDECDSSDTRSFTL